MLDLDESLDLILEDNQDDYNYISMASNLVKRLQATRQQILDIEHELDKVNRIIISNLALGLRRAKPSLNIGVDKHGCKVGYKTKFMTFYPDFNQDRWLITSKHDRFKREFLQQYRAATLITDDLSQLINAIVAYFISHYRTIGEDVDGTGIIMIEDRRSSLLGITQWSHNIIKPLPSRATRYAR